MAGIFANIDSDISKLNQLKAKIEEVKKALTSINVKVDIDIAKGMEEQLKNLTTQYDALVQKVSQAEGKVIASTQRINQAAEKIIKAQEQLAKATGTQPQAGNVAGASTQANQAQTASVQAQAKAYDELATEIDEVMGTRSQNIRRMVEEQNAIRLINAEIKELTKYQGDNASFSSGQQKRLEQLNASLLQHKTALAELRQSLNNSFKLDNAAATSMNALSQSLGRMRMAYRELTEEERNSPFGKELLASIQQADAKIKQLDATIGNHQRNVGNYASGWNGLNMSIQQIGRELPSLAMGINTFFLAISNNLPILTDEIARARKEYNALKAAGQAATPVWKQVVSSLVSWQTALTVGITLLTVYGKDIIAWVGNLFKAKDGTAELEAATKRLNTAVSQVYGSISEEMRNLRSLNDALQNAKRGTDEWESIRQKIVAGYSKYLPSIDSEIEKTGTLAGSYDRLAESIQRAAAARGFEKYRAEEDEKYFEERNKQLQRVYDAFIDQLGNDDGLKQYQKWLRLLDSGEGLSRRQQGEFGQIDVGWGLGNANSVLFELRKAQEAHDKALERYREIFNMSEGAETALPPDSIKAMRESLSARREALEQLSVESEEYAKLKAEIEEDEQRLSKITQSGNTVSQSKSIAQLKSYLDQLAQLRQDNEDRQVDLMQDGTEKELAEIDLRYRRIREKVQELEKELSERQGGSLTQEQSIQFGIAYAGIDRLEQRDKDKIQSSAIQEKMEKEREAMDEYLKEYGTYQEKRLAITREYERKIAEADTEGEKRTLGKQMKEALADLDIEALKTTSAISQLFGDMTDKTLKELERINEEGSAALEFLKGGQWDEQKGIRFGIDKEQFDTISQSPEKLKAISDALDRNREAAEQLRPAYEKVADGLRDLFNAGSDSKKLTQALADIQEGLNECLQAASFLSDAFAGLGDAFGSKALGSIAEGINIAVDSLNSAMKGMQSGAQIGSMFGGVGGAVGSAVGGAVGLFTGIANAIARIHDKKNERRIQRLQDQIDVLTDSYSELGRAVEDAYSKDASGLIEDQNKLLEQQKVLIQQQIKEEEDKKKTDDGRIEQWKQQLEEIDQTIADNKEKAVDAIFGEDLQSAIENFAAAYTEAWASGEDRAESAKDFVRDMMRSMVTESIKGALESSKAIESIRKMMKQFYEDDYLSTLEKALLETAVTNLANNLDEEFGWAADLFKDEEEGATAEEEHEKQIEELQKAYDQLSDAVNKAYSTDKVKALSQQESNLRQQIEATRKAMDEESSANGTGTEWYGELQDQYQELSQQLSDLKEQKIDAIFGEDIQSAIESFVSAYTEALSQGDTSQVSKDFVEGMVQSMVTESMKMDASPVMEQVRQKLVEAWQDGVVTAEEQADVQAVIDRLNQQLADKYQWAEGLFKEEEAQPERTNEIQGLEGLKDAYDRLSDSIARTYSSEKARLLKEQNDLLRQQKTLLEQAIAAEQALGEEANADFIDEWGNQLEEVNQQIQDNKEAQLDAIFGQDTQTAISNLADALIDAWSSGEDRAKTSKEFVNSLIRSMAAEAMKMDISPVMEQLRDQLGGMFADGIISADESGVIQSMVDGLASQLEEQYSWLDQFLEQAEDTAEEVQETFSGITFDNMRDNFVSQLADMSTSYEDMCADMEDQLRQSILQGFLKSKYQGAIQSLLNTWDMYGASGGNIDPDEIEALRQQYKELISAMIQDREDLAQQFGWEQFQQEASRGSYEIASQESVDEQNGRLTAMYESDLRRESIQTAILNAIGGYKGQPANPTVEYTPITEMRQPSKELSARLDNMGDIGTDIRDILANSYLELQQINENTGEIVKPIKQMQQDIAEVKRNTAKL